MEEKQVSEVKAASSRTPWLDRVHPAGEGTQRVYRFANGYGASVVRTPYTYGGDQGKYELGVVKFTGDNFRLTYETPITSDVLGYLSDEEIESALAEIEALPAAESA